MITHSSREIQDADEVPTFEGVLCSCPEFCERRFKFACTENPSYVSKSWSLSTPLGTFGGGWEGCSSSLAIKVYTRTPARLIQSYSSSAWAALLENTHRIHGRATLSLSLCTRTDISRADAKRIKVRKLHHYHCHCQFAKSALGGLRSSSQFQASRLSSGERI